MNIRVHTYYRHFSSFFQFLIYVSTIFLLLRNGTYKWWFRICFYKISTRISLAMYAKSIHFIRATFLQELIKIEFDRAVTVFTFVFHCWVDWFSKIFLGSWMAAEYIFAASFTFTTQCTMYVQVNVVCSFWCRIQYTLVCLPGWLIPPFIIKFPCPQSIDVPSEYRDV